MLGDPDPLIPEPPDEINTSLPDDGSGSTQFVFRCRYRNGDGLPPLPWLHDMDDPWNWYGGAETGVVLYLDENGTGDYKPHFMRLEDPNKNAIGSTYAGGDSIYIYRIIPHDIFGAVAPCGALSVAERRLLYHEQLRITCVRSVPLLLRLLG